MSYQPLQGFSSVQDSSLSNDIQDTLVEYFDWALLEKGNYFNVELNETSPEGEDYSRLRLSSDEQYASGQVWEGFRKNWVWQSGVSGVGMDAPIVGTNRDKPGISGVYVNGVFEPSSGVGTYAHKVDYFNGRVIFDSAIPSGSTVQAEHSYKYINVVYANNVPWLREIQNNTIGPNSNFMDVGKGAWDTLPQSRLQLPAIAIEVVPQRRFEAYQLGGGQIVYTDILCHCIAEDEYTRNMLIDIVSLQNRKTFFLLDNNTINNSGAFPLDYEGTPVPSALHFPELLEQYNGGKVWIDSITVNDMSMATSEVFGGIVKLSTKGIKLNI